MRCAKCGAELMNGEFVCPYCSGTDGEKIKRVRSTEEVGRQRSTSVHRDSGDENMIPNGISGRSSEFQTPQNQAAPKSDIGSAAKESRQYENPQYKDFRDDGIQYGNNWNRNPIDHNFENRIEKGVYSDYTNGYAYDQSQYTPLNAGLDRYQQIPMTRKDFIKLEQNNNLVRDVNICAIICYIGATINLCFTGIMYRQIGVSALLGFIDVTVILLLGLFLHIKKSFPAAVVILAFGIISMLLTSFGDETPSGWLYIIIGSVAIRATRKLDNAWKEYNNRPQNVEDRYSSFR